MSDEDVRRFLRDRGLADEVIAAGAAGLIERWEQAARDLERERYPFLIEDWLDELDGRQLVHEIGASIPGALNPALAARLAEADERVRAGTDTDSVCLWGDSLARRLGWEPAQQWWYWRRPSRVAGDFEGDPDAE